MRPQTKAGGRRETSFRFIFLFLILSRPAQKVKERQLPEGAIRLTRAPEHAIIKLTAAAARAPHRQPLLKAAGSACVGLELLQTARPHTHTYAGAGRPVLPDCHFLFGGLPL